MASFVRRYTGIATEKNCSRGYARTRRENVRGRCPINPHVVELVITSRAEKMTITQEIPGELVGEDENRRQELQEKLEEIVKRKKSK
jgi:hypothetical protein